MMSRLRVWRLFKPHDSFEGGDPSPVPDPVTNQVEQVYEKVGRTMAADVTYDAQTSEDLRKAAMSYVSEYRVARP